MRPLRRMLPDLEVLAPSVATFGHPEPIFGDSAPDGSSCFSSEIDEQGARVCLRFGQRAANIGSGPVDVRWSVDAQVPETRSRRSSACTAATARSPAVGRQHALPPDPRPLPLRGLLAVDAARGGAERAPQERAARGRAQERVLHGRHRDALVGAEGRRRAVVSRTALPRAASRPSTAASTSRTASAAAGPTSTPGTCPTR